MGELGRKLRSVKSATRSGIAHWCPGCEDTHVIWTDGAAKPNWTWDGNVDAPTTTPSVRLFTTRNGVETTTCHYFLTGGSIVFCGDCQHALSGQKVPLPDLPPHIQD